MAKFVVVIVALLFCGTIAEEQSQGDALQIAPLQDDDVKGTPITIQNWNSIVSLHRGPATVFTHVCAGNILTVSYILSVASCFESSWGTDYSRPEFWRVRAGSATPASGGVFLQLNGTLKHPEWDQNSFDYDIVILQLATSLILSATVGQAIIPGQGSTIATNSLVKTAGWGTSFYGIHSTTLLESDFQIMTAQFCQNAYDPIVVSERMICSHVPIGGNETCIVDYGGPMVANGLLHGLASWAYGCGVDGYPVVNTRTSLFTFWIINNARSDEFMRVE